MEELKNRLSVMGAIYYETEGENPDGVQYVFSRDLDTDEQVFHRNLKATEDWQRLDCGWLPNPGMLLIINNEGKFSVNPTAEEQEEASRKVLEICYSSPNPSGYLWLVLPGESMRGHPSNAQELHIRCQSGDAKFTVHLFPR